jgi:hypothetical protein
MQVEVLRNTLPFLDETGRVDLLTGERQASHAVDLLRVYSRSQYTGGEFLFGYDDKTYRIRLPTA